MTTLQLFESLSQKFKGVEEQLKQVLECLNNIATINIRVPASPPDSPQPSQAIDLDGIEPDPEEEPPLKKRNVAPQKAPPVGVVPLNKRPNQPRK